MLLKLTQVANSQYVINILQAAFALIFFCQKITKPNYQKSAGKMLMKLAKGCSCCYSFLQVKVNLFEI